MDPRFKKLFKIDLHPSHSNAYKSINRASAAFKVEDIEKLVEIISAKQPEETVVFHALVALLYLDIGKHSSPQIIRAVVQGAINCHPTKDQIDDLTAAFLAVLAEIGPAALETLYEAGHFLCLESKIDESDFGAMCVFEAAHLISVETLSLSVCRKTAQVMLDILLELHKLRAQQPRNRAHHFSINTLGGQLWKMAKFERTNEMLGALRAAMMDTWRTIPYNCDLAWVDVLCNVGIEPNPNDPAINLKPFPSSAEAEKMWRKRHGTTPAPTDGPFPGEPGYVVPPAREWLPAMRCESGSCGLADIFSPAHAGGEAGGGTALERLLAVMKSGAFDEGRQTPYDKTEAQLLGCRGCQAVLYCSPTCQRACWTAYGPALLRGDPVPPQGPLGRLHKDNLGNKAGDIHKLDCKLLQQIKGEVPAEQASTQAPPAPGSGSMAL